jgi:hypothetical protein
MSSDAARSTHGRITFATLTLDPDEQTHRERHDKSRCR